jgi:hypothetical protein
MTTNKYFRPFTYGRQQDLAEDLIVQAIKIYGLDVKYLPRTLQNVDPLLGEDPTSTFDDAVDIEVYIKNVQGFEGEGDFLSKFNLQINDSITFTMARKRWNQITTEKLITEVGYNYQVETADTNSWGNTQCIMLESGNGNNYSITTPRPFEGDWIYFPLNKKLYEIKFVEHEAIFYQHGKLYTYDLNCELVDRIGPDAIATGNTDIDAIGTRYDQNILIYQTMLEDGTYLMNEDGGFMLNEYRIEVQTLTANNEYFTQKSLEFIDFSERNPFSEVDRY